MRIINRKKNEARQSRRPLTIMALLVAALLSSGCYTPQAYRDFQSTGIAPWWCQGVPSLTESECLEFSLKLDVAVNYAYQYPTVADYTIANPGAFAVANAPSGIGRAYVASGSLPTVFDHAVPNVLLYDGSDPGSRLVGIAWSINSGVVAPSGYMGDRDVWVQDSADNWWLSAWVIRGYQNHPNVFAATHPCLTSTGSILTSTTDACFTQSHTEPFEVLVTNDDGYSADGIDALVEGLYGLPNVTVHVVAPLANQSGSSDQTTQSPYVVDGAPATTNSGRAATAVSSTDLAAPRNGSGSPADSVLYAFGVMDLSPELVISGINKGQNMGPVTTASGTVGAARTARRNGVPAIGTSQGAFTQVPDFPTGVTATLALLEEWRLGRTVNTTASVLNINAPSCVAGFSARGTVQTVVAPSMNGRSYTDQDCASTNTLINDDVDAFNNGYIGITDMGVNQPANWP